MTSGLKTSLGSKDFWAGMLFLFIGGIFAAESRNYRFGTAVRMGPGYLPTVLAGMLALIGLVLVFRALLKPGEAVGRLALGKAFWVILSTVLFALLLRRLGVVVSLMLLVIPSAYASIRFRWPVALLLALGLAVGSSIVFVWLLQLPLPLFGPWLGG